MSSAAPGQFSYAVAPELADILAPPRRRGRIMTFVCRNPSIGTGGTLLLVIVLIAILAPWLGTVDPTAIEVFKRGREPSAQFWFGTDMLGRDVYSRVIYGGRISLIVGIAAAVLSAVIGTFIGLMSGFSLADAIVMRVMDGLMSVPSILLAIALMALTRASVENVILAISVADFPRVSRLIRGWSSLREQPFVEAAFASGTRMPKIIPKHILPNTLAPLLVNATFGCASAMIAEATLSFIGAGTRRSSRAGATSWLREGDLADQALYRLLPAAFLCITVFAVNMLGDGLRDALDPRLAKHL